MFHVNIWDPDSAGTILKGTENCNFFYKEESIQFLIFPPRPPASQPFLPGSAPTPVSQISTFQQYGPPPASVQQLRNHMAGMTIGSTAASAPPPAGLGYGKVSWLQKYAIDFHFC